MLVTAKTESEIDTVHRKRKFTVQWLMKTSVATEDLQYRRFWIVPTAKKSIAVVLSLPLLSLIPLAVFLFLGATKSQVESADVRSCKASTFQGWNYYLFCAQSSMRSEKKGIP